MAKKKRFYLKRLKPFYDKGPQAGGGYGVRQDSGILGSRPKLGGYYDEATGTFLSTDDPRIQRGYGPTGRPKKMKSGRGYKGPYTIENPEYLNRPVGEPYSRGGYSKEDLIKRYKDARSSRMPVKSSYPGESLAYPDKATRIREFRKRKAMIPSSYERGLVPSNKSLVPTKAYEKIGGNIVDVGNKMPLLKGPSRLKLFGKRAGKALGKALPVVGGLYGAYEAYQIGKDLYNTFFGDKPEGPMEKALKSKKMDQPSVMTNNAPVSYQTKMQQVSKNPLSFLDTSQKPMMSKMSMFQRAKLLEKPIGEKYFKGAPRVEKERPFMKSPGQSNIVSGTPAGMDIDYWMNRVRFNSDKDMSVRSKMKTPFVRGTDRMDMKDSMMGDGDVTPKRLKKRSYPEYIPSYYNRADIVVNPNYRNWKSRGLIKSGGYITDLGRKYLY